MNTSPVDNGQGDDDDGGDTADGAAVDTPAEVVEDGNQAQPESTWPLVLVDSFGLEPMVG